MSKKIELTNIADEDNGKKYVFASYLRKDYVDKSLVIYTKEDSTINEMIFSSNDFGVAEWENGKGIRDSHFWEQEDEARDISYLSRRYTAILSDGKATNEYAINKIIADVVNHIEDKNFTDLLVSIVTEKNTEERLNIKDFLFNVSMAV